LRRSSKCRQLDPGSASRAVLENVDNQSAARQYREQGIGVAFGNPVGVGGTFVTTRTAWSMRTDRTTSSFAPLRWSIMV